MTAICFSASTIRPWSSIFQKTETTFLKQFSYKVSNPSELRITVFLLADRDSTSNGGVNLSVTSIDTDVLIPSTRQTS